MPNIDSVQSSLYFLASQKASSQAAKDAEKSKSKRGIAGKFLDMIHQNQDSGQNNVNLSEQLAREIAGMSEEEALLHLKDNADIAGDNLKKNPNSDTFLEYKKSISNFLQYIINKSYEMESVPGSKFIDKKTGRVKQRKEPYAILKTIDAKLDQLAVEMVYNHMDKIRIASKVDEIKGILIDLIS